MYSGQSACSGDCIVKWPVYSTKLILASKQVWTRKHFGVITRADGAKQSTYKGWPLYYFQNDAKAGDIKGDSVGGTWFTAKPDYTVALGKAQLVGKDGVKYTSKYVRRRRSRLSLSLTITAERCISSQKILSTSTNTHWPTSVTMPYGLFTSRQQYKIFQLS